MESLIANPIIQSAVIPFFTALLATMALRRFGWLWAGLGLALGFYLSVYVVIGIEFTPLTSTRKIILLGLIAVVVGLVVDGLLHRDTKRRDNSNLLVAIAAALAAAAALWVIWPVASRKEGTAFWILIVAAMFYSSAIVALFERLKTNAEKSAAAMLAIGVGTGVCTLLGASAKLGQLSSAIGAAAGAYVLVLLFSKTLRFGSSFTLTGALLVSLIGIAGVVYAKLPWYILVILMLIPAVLALPMRPVRLPALIVYALATLPIAGIAIYLTWKIAGAPPI